MYIRPATAAVSGTATLADFRAAATEVAGRLYLQAGQIRYNVNGSDLVTSGSTVVAADNWYHVAVQKSSTTVKIYLNGAEVGTGTDSANYAAKAVRFGADYAGANGFTGHIDEIRLSNTNRYTTIPFTPQAGIFQGDANLSYFFTSTVQIHKLIRKIGLALKDLPKVKTSIMMRSLEQLK
ncbi:MAG: hypothetical protein CM15mV41_1330 [Caudoviricetes sp.]|nr:MAG: hypothetical protein CM15mV41_1330 [Caudoviricetes sp.]